MKPRSCFFALILLFTILACIVPPQPTPSGGQSAPDTSRPPSSTSRVTSTASPTDTTTATFTPLPDLSDSGLNFAGPATATPTYTPTKPSLPPLPDFNDVLSFGGGGGGDYWPCVYKGYSPAIFGESFGFLQRTAILCLWGISFDEPFQIKMVSPDGQITLTENFLVNSSTMKLTWLDHENAVIETQNTIVNSGANGPEINIGIWWPVNLPIGTWQVSVLRNENILAQGDFIAEKLDWRRLSIVDGHSRTEIIPVDKSEAHRLEPQQAANGVDIMGDRFIPNSNSVILLFKKIDIHKWTMIYKTYASVDGRGVLKLHIPGPLNENNEYLVVGIADPATYPSLDTNGNLKFDAYDEFNFKTYNSASLISCPGAPRQRMIVNQRGYVCTRSDAVRLRDEPSRSAGVLVRLPTGTQFTVVGGPSCADNWSWWQVQVDVGYTGWLSEGGDAVDPYFICPLP